MSSEKGVATGQLEPLIGPETIAAVLELRDASGKPRVSAVYELSRRRARDPLPVFRVGKYLRAWPSEIREWLERQRVRRPR